MLSAVDEVEQLIPVTTKDKRILWLINHTTLREFEVALLRQLGFEVFTPKCIPALIYEWSGSVDYSHDKSLTIPPEVLNELNHFDFYGDPITPKIAELLNNYFGTAICIFYPFLLNQIAKQFNGRILIRAFGIDKNASYTSIIQEQLGKNFIDCLKSLEHRLWFAQAYDNLDEVECDFLKKRSVTLPLGLPTSFFQHQNTWVGGIDKILFFCSRINASPAYYGKIYSEFKKNFGDLPYTVAGNQPVHVNDPCVVGLQPRSKIDEWLRTYAVMFYHSQEPRHLHYHPLEAIVFGMPLIYMRKGILEKLGGEHQPGACSTFEEAKQKILRILKGDKAFIEKIRNSQKEILKTFSFDFNRQEWENKFVKGICAVTPISSNLVNKYNPIKTICVFLPVGYRGGSFNGAKNIAKMIHIGSRLANEPIKVIFSCIEDTYDLEKDFSDLREYGIPVRETFWKEVTTDKVNLIQRLQGYRTSLSENRYCLPTDGLNDFQDCDFWLSVSDRFISPLAPIKPYGIVVYDYIQRYVPEILSETFDDISYLKTARNADFVLTTTPTTREDAIQYGGVNPSRVHLVPMEFNPFEGTWNEPHEKNYLLWPTNVSQHKNHLNTVEALDIYYRLYKGSLKTIVTGYMTERFNYNKDQPETYLYFKEIIQRIQSSNHCKRNLDIRGYVPVNTYMSILSGAKFLLHPTFIDNGTYSVIEAAYYGVPSLSSNYPQMRFIDERFKLNLMFFDAHSPKDIALKLKMMEEKCAFYKEKLPSRTYLDQFSFEKTALEFWKIIKSLI